MQGKSSATNFDIWQKFEFEFMLFERVIYFSLLYWNNISTKNYSDETWNSNFTLNSNFTF